jgi:hypothetical protein
MRNEQLNSNFTAVKMECILFDVDNNYPRYLLLNAEQIRTIEYLLSEDILDTLRYEFSVLGINETKFEEI